MKKEIFLVEPAELRRLLHEELEKFFDVMKNQNSAHDEWLDSKDVPAYLKVSRKTWQDYRNRRLIPFSQIGRKIQVRKSDLDAFLDAYTVRPIVEYKSDEGHGAL